MRLLNKFERLSFWAHEPVAMVLKPDMSTPGQLPPLKRGSPTQGECTVQEFSQNVNRVVFA